jgi:D-amino peptidase
VTLRAQSPALADLFCQWPAFERVDGVTLRFTAATVEAAVRMLNCCSAMSSMLR